MTQFRDFIKNDGVKIEDFILAADQCYNSNPNAKRAYVELELSDEQLAEFIKCRLDVHYFINTYIKTISIDDGIVPLKLYDYQLDLVQSFVDHRFNIALQARQSGKTTTVAAFILWYAIFHSSKNVAVLANKAMQAQEIVSRITTMLDWLPNFLKPGMLALNKRNLKFENGSNIFSAATSSASIRGQAVSLLYIDEAAFIPNDIEFYESTYPTITSGKNSRVIMSSTPKGARGLFYKLYTDAENGNNEFKHTKVTWDKVPGRDEAWKQETIRNTSEAQFLQEMECHFMGSQDTLIASRILQTLVYHNPEIDDGLMRIYKKPQEGRKYVCTVDTAEGVERDYSALSVIDITEVPYEVVAIYRNNKISPLLYPTLVENIARRYNMALVLCELNSVGHTVANILYHDYEYENMAMVGSRKGRQALGEGINMVPGVKTTQQTKAIGCSNMKTLIETGKLVVNDIDIIAELGTFVAKGKSFEADEGANDDLVATLFMFGWMTGQEFFKEYNARDIRVNIMKNDELLFESLTPFGVSTKLQDEYEEYYKEFGGDDDYGHGTSFLD